jgi:transposase
VGDKLLGEKARSQDELFAACSLRELVPEDHILKQVNKVLKLSWLKEEVREVYHESQGRPSIAPEAALRLMLAGYFAGIVHDRKLMREAQVNLAIRWFAGYRLDDKLPHHSSLTRIRQRWGAERFKRIFQRIVRACIDAGLVDGETVHVDSTLIRADVSWESLSLEHARKVLEENEEKEKPKKSGRGRAPKGGGKLKKRSKTDPEATMSTSSHNNRMEPSYKQHTAVDDKAGVIVDVEVTTGESSEGKQLPEQIERIEANTGKKLNVLTADAGYAHGKNYEELELENIEAIIPPQTERKTAQKIPITKFKYDGKHKLVRCPGGKTLECRGKNEHGYIYRSKAKDCRECPLRKRCFSENASNRTILISHGYESLLRARRRWRRAYEEDREYYKRHRWRVEGKHGEAKTQHGLRRAVRRGLKNMSIQCFLTGMVMNLKCLAKAFLSKFLFRELIYSLKILKVLVY